MKNVGLNEIIAEMLKNGTDNVEATYKTNSGLEITLDIVMIKVVKDGKVVYEVETEELNENNKN